MLNAISSSTYSSLADTTKSSADLEAQLDRYQKELSSCLDCSSSNTQEGQKNIQTLSNKISALQTRIEAITASKLNVPKLNTQSAASNARTPTEITENKDTLVSGVQYNAVGASNTATTPVGNYIDVFA